MRLASVSGGSEVHFAREMTGGDMTWSHDLCWWGRLTNCLRGGTSRAEPAARWRIDRTWHVAVEQDALTRPFLLRIGIRIALRSAWE